MDQQRRQYENDQQLYVYKREANKQLADGELQRSIDQRRDKQTLKFQEGLLDKKNIKESEDRLDLKEQNYKKVFLLSFISLLTNLFE